VDYAFDQDRQRLFLFQDNFSLAAVGLCIVENAEGDHEDDANKKQPAHTIIDGLNATSTFLMSSMPFFTIRSVPGLP